VSGALGEGEREGGVIVIFVAVFVTGESYGVLDDARSLSK